MVDRNYRIKMVGDGDSQDKFLTIESKKPERSVGKCLLRIMGITLVGLSIWKTTDYLSNGFEERDPFAYVYRHN